MVTVVGCASRPAEPEPAISAPAIAAPPPWSTEPTETAFTSLEQRVGRVPLRLRFEVSAEGAFTAAMSGALATGDEVELLAAGRFGDDEHDLRLWTEGDRVHAGPRDAPTLDVPCPRELEAALVIGSGRALRVARVARAAPPGRWVARRSWGRGAQRGHGG